MPTLLAELCEHYSQDFDLIFERDTDPLDLFCLQHDLLAQRKLLDEMKSFYQEVLVGKKSHHDLVKMGLEYTPKGDRSLKLWWPSLINYLEEKTAHKF